MFAALSWTKANAMLSNLTSLTAETPAHDQPNKCLCVGFSTRLLGYYHSSTLTDIGGKRCVIRSPRLLIVRMPSDLLRLLSCAAE